jgi:hypothetical protein
MPTLLLEDGDKVTVPARPSFVGVYGAVFADSSLLHRQHYSASDYLRAAGLKRDADVDNALIIRADGSVVGSSTSALFGVLGNQLSQSLYPGDSIYVPEKFDRETAYNKFIRGAKDWTSILYQLSLGAAAVKTLRD